MFTIVAIMAILEKGKSLISNDRNCCNYGNSEYNYCMNSLMLTIVAIMTILKKIKLLVVAIVALQF